VIVVDSSAWVDVLRARDTPAARALRWLLERNRGVALTEVVLMELLAGSAKRDLGSMTARLSRFPVIPLRGQEDFEAAAELYRRCRDAGDAVRELSDCLVAVPAIRVGAPVLHADADFDRLARHTPLQVVPLA
jgi:predicted nucleic acid-binding protein